MRINETPIALTHSQCHTVAEPILELSVHQSSFRSYAVVPASGVCQGCFNNRVPEGTRQLNSLLS